MIIPDFSDFAKSINLDEIERKFLSVKSTHPAMFQIDLSKPESLETALHVMLEDARLLAVQHSLLILAEYHEWLRNHLSE